MYLVRHRELGEYRAVKAVTKNSLGYDSFRREALLMKDLHHPGIPVIYDLEEDEEYGYLIEEYLQGISLEQAVTDHEPLDRRSILKYLIQICQVIDYLHTSGTEPVLHLDLQPRNLLVCRNGIKLIDFGQAARMSQANRSGKRFGTVGFAAPEQYDCSQDMDQRTDIFAIGCLFFYLVTGSPPDRSSSSAGLGQRMWSREAGRVLEACLAQNQKERYQTAEQLRTDLEALLEDTVSSLIVAVYGNEPCTGATHISLALSACLWRMGIPNRYEECHPFGKIRRLKGEREKLDQSGCFSYGSCVIKPYYGKQAVFMDEEYPVVIQDRGAADGFAHSVLPQSSPAAVILTAGGKPWNQVPDREFMKIYEKKLFLIYSFSSPGFPGNRPERLPKGGLFRAPLFSDPFFPDQKAEKWLRLLWKQMMSRMDEPSRVRILSRKGRETAGKRRSRRQLGMFENKGEKENEQIFL